MKLLSTIFKSAVLLTTAFTVQLIHAAQVDPSLTSFAKGESRGKNAKVVALFDTQKLSTRMPTRYQTKNVIEYFKQATNEAWSGVASQLQLDSKNQKEIKLHSLHWINASASFAVTPEGLKTLANVPGITKIYNADRQVTREPTKLGRKGRSIRGESLPYDFTETKLDQLMQEAPTITGENVLLGHVDTGADGKHPALQGKFAVFYNAQTKKVEEPTDPDEHGTHTAGTIAGGDRTQNIFGMAPGAKLISSAALAGYDDMLDAMEFMISGKSGTQIPRAISNSWNCEGAPDVELFYKAISAWEAAGVLPVFSAGNAGPKPKSITRPHEHPLTLAVGATGQDGKIADFSSVGPGIYQGKETQKPDLTAPGVNIRSSIPGGGYGEMSGTSMAAPHVTGAVGLVLQANPALNPQQIKALLMKTTVPVDQNGAPTGAGTWNPVYGLGKLNIYQAVKSAATGRGKGPRASGVSGILSSLMGDAGRVFQNSEEKLMEEISSLEAADLSDWSDSFHVFHQADETWVDGAAL